VRQKRLGLSSAHSYFSRAPVGAIPHGATARSTGSRSHPIITSLYDISTTTFGFTHTTPRARREAELNVACAPECPLSGYVERYSVPGETCRKARCSVMPESRHVGPDFTASRLSRLRMPGCETRPRAGCGQTARLVR
jgi:hypothetical protein